MAGLSRAVTLALAAAGAGACTQGESPAAWLRVAPEVVDLGEFEVVTPKRFDLRLSNPTGEVVHIDSTRSSCGCLLVMDPPESIAPGESSIIPVELKDARAGRFEQFVEIRWSAPQSGAEGASRVAIRGVRRAPDLEVSPCILLITIAGEEGSGRCVLRAADGTTIRSIDLEVEGPGVALPEPPGPGGSSGFRFQVPGPWPGPGKGLVLVRAELSDGRVLHAEVPAERVGSGRPAPPSRFLGSLVPGQVVELDLPWSGGKEAGTRCSVDSAHIAVIDGHVREAADGSPSLVAKLQVGPEAAPGIHRCMLEYGDRDWRGQVELLVQIMTR